MRNIFYYDTVIGKIGIAEEDGAITDIIFGSEARPDFFNVCETAIIKDAAKQLMEYFAGNRRNFDLPLSTDGTAFQTMVWEALKSIPYGETRSYKDIAVQIGKAKACRAVGMANNRNSIPIIIPCHRVIGAKGKLTGYGGGLGIKEQLLIIEGNTIAKGKVL